MGITFYSCKDSSKIIIMTGSNSLQWEFYCLMDRRLLTHKYTVWCQFFLYGTNNYQAFFLTLYKWKDYSLNTCTLKLLLTSFLWLTSLCIYTNGVAWLQLKICYCALLSLAPLLSISFLAPYQNRKILKFSQLQNVCRLFILLTTGTFFFSGRC